MATANPYKALEMLTDANIYDLHEIQKTMVKAKRQRVPYHVYLKSLGKKQTVQPPKETQSMDCNSIHLSWADMADDEDDVLR
jgi:hypothetical protein